MQYISIATLLKMLGINTPSIDFTVRMKDNHKAYLAKRLSKRDKAQASKRK